MNRDLHPATLRAMTSRYVVGMVLYIAAFALTFLNAVLSFVLVIGLALIFVLPEPGSQPEESAEAARTTAKRGGD